MKTKDDSGKIGFFTRKRILVLNKDNLTVGFLRRHKPLPGGGILLEYQRKTGFKTRRYELVVPSEAVETVENPDLREDSWLVVHPYTPHGKQRWLESEARILERLINAQRQRLEQIDRLEEDLNRLANREYTMKTLLDMQAAIERFRRGLLPLETKTKLTLTTEEKEEKKKEE